jgi:hypothetical protein
MIVSKSLSMYPWAEIPFDAYCYILDRPKLVAKLEKFGSRGSIAKDYARNPEAAMVLYYPQYILDLYVYADMGMDYKERLKELGFGEGEVFRTVFPREAKKLDSLCSKKVKHNYISETKLRIKKNKNI